MMTGLFRMIRARIFRKSTPTKNRERKDKKLDRSDLWDGVIPTQSNIHAVQERPLYDSDPVANPISRHEYASQKPAGEADDLLLGKIDEFREKAKLLQELLLNKESKARELQEIVEEREIKAEELQQLLEERQEAAEGVTAEVVKRLDSIFDRVSVKLDSVEGTIREDISGGTRVNAANSQQISDAVTAFGRQLESIQNDVTGLNDTVGGITSSMQGMNSAIDGLTSNISGITNSMSGISENIDEISDQIHSENVKSYRNTVDLFKEMDDKLDKLNDMNTEMKNVRKFAIGAVVFSVINLVAAAAFFAFSTFF